jgi:YVTN family beta-propeller protein
MLKLLLSAFMFFLVSCSDPTNSENDVNVSLTGVFILNEGNFGASNGTLSFYDPQQKTVQNNIFQNINSRDLGDVVQSMTIIDSLGYIVVNNSATIEIISLQTWLSKGTINLSGASPRILAPVSGSKAYVSNLYSGNVLIIDPGMGSVSGTITVGTNPDAIVIAEGKAYVANHGYGWDNTISVIDTETDQVINTIFVADNPAGMDRDEFGNIHVYCSGNYVDFNDPNDDTDGGIYIINPISDTVIDSVIITGHPAGGYTNHNGKGYYMLNGVIYAYPVGNVGVAHNSLISGFFYDFNVNKQDGRIFALDAKDYTQAGDLKIYDSFGTLQETHTVGIIPAEVVFIYDQD